MKWGHKVATQNGPVEATRAEYNEAFGAEVPDEPEPPLEHVWDWFWLLNARRQSNLDGAGPITYEQVGWWSSITKTLITPSEVRLLMAMDDAFLDQVSKEKESRREREREKNKGNH